jgi:3-hydroxyisobutyrate dehydrogenase
MTAPRRIEQQMQIGWVGLGAIGTNMVLRALDAGHSVTAYARGQGQAAVQAQGAALSSDYTALAARSEIVALCLFDDDQLRRVVFDDGLLAAMRPGAILAIHTTGAPALAREIGARAPAGVSVLDATFSGGPHNVLAGQLTMMVGGDAAAIECARPVLGSYAKQIFHAGALGSGQVIKLLNNLLFAANLKNAAELLSVAESLGLAPAAAAEVIQSCSGASAALRSFQSPSPIAETLRRIQPYVGKDVATIAKTSAESDIDISAFADAIAYFRARSGL